MRPKTATRIKYTFIWKGFSGRLTNGRRSLLSTVSRVIRLPNDCQISRRRGGVGGFPDASRAKVLGDRPLETEKADMLVLGTGTIDAEEYGRWKEAIPLVVSKPAGMPSPVFGTLYGGVPRQMVIPVPDAESVPRRVPAAPLSSRSSEAGSTGSYPAAASETSVGEAVLRDLRNFSVENATPLECLLFVSSLKSSSMAIYDNLEVFKASYDLLLYVFQFTPNVKRDYRYTLAEKSRTISSSFVFASIGRTAPRIGCRIYGRPANGW